MKTATFEHLSRSPEQTRSLAARLGRLLQPGDLVCLQGDLGAGKTTFVQGLAQGWGTQDRVSSPTFVLVNEYTRQDGRILHHLDAYRLEGVPEAEWLGLDDMLATGALVVEWPEKVQAVLPVDYLWITILHQMTTENERILRWQARGRRAAALLQKLMPYLQEDVDAAGP